MTSARLEPTMINSIPFKVFKIKFKIKVNLSLKHTLPAAGHNRPIVEHAKGRMVIGDQMQLSRILTREGKSLICPWQLTDTSRAHFKVLKNLSGALLLHHAA